MAQQYDHMRKKAMDAKKHPDRNMPQMKEGSPAEERGESASLERSEKRKGID